MITAQIPIPNLTIQFAHNNNSRQLEKLNSFKYFLVDNGSLRPESILYMRKVARALELETKSPILQSGIMHSHKVDTGNLNNKPGSSMDSFFRSIKSDEEDKLAFIPMFLGPSLAITDWLPSQLDKWKGSNLEKRFAIADTLYRKGDDRIARALHDLVTKELSKKITEKVSIVLVDHGTPLLAVNRVREEVGSQLKGLLAQSVSGFFTACMERRSGKDYDFNNPLLDKVLEEVYSRGESVVLAQLFLTPGRHAGPDGDLASICEPFEKRGMKVLRTPTLGDHPLILEILAERFFELNDGDF